jgi:twitching motility two-component system response regulator PilH
MKEYGKLRSKILVVDDDMEYAMGIKAILESRDYVVITANNKAAGMEKAKTETPDLIILDVMMEGRHDGFEMARALKNEPQCKDTPILLLTSITEKTGTDFKSEAGDPSWMPVEGYLDKTVKPDVLIAEVEKLLAG